MVFRAMELEKIPKRVGSKLSPRAEFWKEETQNRRRKKDQWYRRENLENMGSWDPSEQSISRKRVVTCVKYH